MKNKILATLGSFVVMFVLSALFHLTVADKIYPPNPFMGDGSQMPNLGPIAAGYFVLAFMMVFLYSKYTEKGDYMKKGGMFGAAIGVLISLPLGLIFISVVNYPPTAVVIDTVWAIIEQGIGGIVIAYVMQMKMK